MATDLSAALEIAVGTDSGMVRSHNEDAVYAKASLGLAILADGMGGYNAGEVASGMATALLASELEKAIGEAPLQAIDAASGQPFAHRLLLDQIAQTNAAIYRAAESQPQYAGMGTTLVVVLFYDGRLSVAHIGDSRLYRLREGRLEQLTRDHSLLQEQIDSGMITADEARQSLNKNLVTRALGVDPTVEIELHDHDVQPGDILLLCSDGLNDMVSDEEIALTLQSLAANLELAAAQLIQMANDNGGRDNVSVILVKVVQDYPAPRAWWSRFLAWLK